MPPHAVLQERHGARFAWFQVLFRVQGWGIKVWGVGHLQIQFGLTNCCHRLFFPEGVWPQQTESRLATRLGHGVSF
jgi:hypothetical protein